MALQTLTQRDINILQNLQLNGGCPIVARIKVTKVYGALLPHVLLNVTKNELSALVSLS